MSAHAAVNSWGQWVGYCTACNETTSGNRSRVNVWADEHKHDTVTIEEDE